MRTAWDGEDARRVKKLPLQNRSKYKLKGRAESDAARISSVNSIFHRVLPRVAQRAMRFVADSRIDRRFRFCTAFRQKDNRARGSSRYSSSETQASEKLRERTHKLAVCNLHHCLVLFWQATAAFGFVHMFMKFSFLLMRHVAGTFLQPSCDGASVAVCVSRSDIPFCLLQRRSGRRRVVTHLNCRWRLQTGSPNAYL